ncbi:MAG: sel1 repeat family protein [Verrucomicrobia bacterium]|nr:sel1 repeat family protein [Verrucomicrobiota bacterium]
MGLTLKWLLVFVLMSGLATAAETTLVERAQKGDADAQLHLGLMYATGRGVVRDSTEAVKWYRKAAEQGNATAQGNLGSFYANGEGVPKDAIEGLAWSGATSQPRQAKRFLSRIETTLSVA